MLDLTDDDYDELYVVVKEEMARVTREIFPRPGGKRRAPTHRQLALAHRWPVIGWAGEWADEGTLLSYGVDYSANYRRAATFVDKILKGQGRSRMEGAGAEAFSLCTAAHRPRYCGPPC